MKFLKTILRLVFSIFRKKSKKYCGEETEKKIEETEEEVKITETKKKEDKKPKKFKKNKRR